MPNRRADESGSTAIKQGMQEPSKKRVLEETSRELLGTRVLRSAALGWNSRSEE